ncbi:MAG: hypothetical protein CMM58_13040 [Rhodospirillaceae bacterium]|nr:hypothetical protein [Rhodospirillaceae bacterium]|tara:strand:+ start:1212 stop:1622 length:411 start_codon:yes stop_codon:yes gene_type:complete
MSWQTQVLFPGEAKGTVLRLDAPISFWGGIDPTTSKIILAKHPQKGETIAKKLIVIPEPIGSSSSAAIVLELLYARLAPNALILGTKKDAILPIGVLVAHQMNWGTIPVLAIEDPPFQTGQTLDIQLNGKVQITPS